MQCTTYPLLYGAVQNRLGASLSLPFSVLRWAEHGLDNGGICGFSLNLRVSENCSDGNAFRESGGWIGNWRK